MSEDALRAKQARAARVKELSEGDDGLFAIFAAVERNYMETLLRSDVEDAPLREKVYHRVNALRDVRKALEVVIADGAGATAIIDKLTAQAEMKARTGRKAKV